MARQYKHSAVVYVRYYGEEGQRFRIVKFIDNKNPNMDFAIETDNAIAAYQIAMDFARDNGRAVRCTSGTAEVFERHACSIAHEWTITENPFNI